MPHQKSTHDKNSPPPPLAPYTVYRPLFVLHAIISAWSVKPDIHAPGIVGGDARVYVRTAGLRSLPTTAIMHGWSEYNPPPPSPVPDLDAAISTPVAACRTTWWWQRSDGTSRVGVVLYSRSKE